jgi:hypothetical protein
MFEAGEYRERSKIRSMVGLADTRDSFVGRDGIRH